MMFTCSVPALTWLSRHMRSERALSIGLLAASGRSTELGPSVFAAGYLHHGWPPLRTVLPDRLPSGTMISLGLHNRPMHLRGTPRMDHQEEHAFGDLLKRFRKRARLTQSALAERIGALRPLGA